MSDNWVSYKLAPDGDVEDGCHPDEAQALKDYLRQKTTTAEAAQAITRPVITADNPREDLVRLWAFLMDALLELPREHTEPLMALLQAIEDLPKPEFTAPESNQPSDKLWKGLPGFGHLWSDSYQSGNWRKTARAIEGPERDAIRGKHVRKAEIEARLVTVGLAGIPIDWGYEVVADALESRNAILDLEIPTATEWLVLCSKRFRHDAENNEKSWALKPHITNSANAPSRDLWRAPTDEVMNLERWSMWKERLRELQVEPGVVKDAAERALDAMHKEE